MEYSLWSLGLSWLIMILMGICYGYCTPMFSFGKIIPPTLPFESDIIHVTKSLNASSYDTKSIWVAYNELEKAIKNIESDSVGLTNYPLTRFIWLPMGIVLAQDARPYLSTAHFSLYLASLLVFFVVSILLSKKLLHVNYVENRIYFDGLTFEGEKIQLPWESESCKVSDIINYLEFPIFFLSIHCRQGHIAQREEYSKLASTAMVAIFVIASFAIRGVV